MFSSRNRLCVTGLKIASFAPHEVSRLVLRAVKEGRSDIPLWKAIVARAHAILPQMTPSDVSVVCFGLGKMKLRDRQLLEKIASFIIPKLPAMSMNDISHLLAGFARVEVRNDLLFDLAGREIGRQMQTCKSLAELSNVVHSYTQLNYEHPLLFETVGKRVMLLLPLASHASTANEVAKLVDSLTRSSVPVQPRLFAMLSSEICKRIDEFPVHAIAMIANSYARRNLLGSNVFLCELILDESFKRRNEFDSVSVSLLVNSVSRFPEKSKSILVFDFFTSDLAKRGLGKFDLQSVTMLASGLGRFYKNKKETAPKELEKLFQLIGDRVAQVSDQLTSKQVASLARAFASVGVRHGPLLYNLPAHVARQIEGMSLSEIASVLHAYGQLGIRNDTLLDCTPNRVMSLLTEKSTSSQSSDSCEERDIFALSTGSNPTRDPRSTTKAAVDILESYALLMVNNRRVVNSVTQFIEANGENVSTKDLVDVLPKALNALMVPCPQKLYDRIMSEQERLGATLTESQLESIQLLQPSSHYIEPS